MRHYTFRDNRTGVSFKSTEPVTCSPDGNDVTLISKGNEFDGEKYDSAEDEARAKDAAAKAATK